MKEINPWRKMSLDLMEWIHEAQNAEMANADALLETSENLSKSQLRFLRNHGVSVHNERDIVHGVANIDPTQILCIGSREFVIRMQLSRGYVTVQKVVVE